MAPAREYKSWLKYLHEMTKKLWNAEENANKQSSFSIKSLLLIVAVNYDHTILPNAQEKSRNLFQTYHQDQDISKLNSGVYNLLRQKAQGNIGDSKLLLERKLNDFF